MWYLLILIHLAGTVGFNLLLRRSMLRRADQWFTATVLQTGLFLPFLVLEIVHPIQLSGYTPFALLLLAVAVTMLVALQYCNVKALQYLEASVFSVVYNVRILFATLLGMLLLAEPIGPWALLGGGLIFASIFIVRQKGAGAITKHGLLYGLGAAAAISIMNACEKELIHLVGYQQYIFPMFAIATVIMWVVVLYRRTPAPLHLLVQRQNLLLMFLRACAGIGFSAALIFGPLAVTSYLSSLSVVLVVLFGMIFLGERDYMKSKLAAAGVALLGLTCVLIGNLT